MSRDGANYSSDGFDESGVEHGQFIMRLWNRTAWILYRSVFASLRDYLYAVTWSTFVAREASAETVEVDPDADDAERRRALVDSGMCILGARIVKLNDGAFDVAWDGRQGHKMDGRSQVWLSRTDPEIDAEKHPFLIQEKRTRGMTLAAGYTLPSEYADMTWRVDLLRNPVVDHARLHSIKTFSSSVDSRLRDLVVDDVMRQEAETKQLNSKRNDSEGYDDIVRHEIRRVSRKYSLNGDQ